MMIMIIIIIIDHNHDHDHKIYDHNITYDQNCYI